MAPQMMLRSFLKSKKSLVNPTRRRASHGAELIIGKHWLVGFVAVRPKSTAMVIAGRSVHLTTLFPGQA